MHSPRPHSSVRFNAVYVIESLREGERRTGSDLYDNVIGPAAFNRQGLDTHLFSVRSRAEFLATLSDIEERAHHGRAPVLHLEAHGNPEGLELTSGEFVTWPEMKRSLQEINYQSGFIRNPAKSEVGRWWATRGRG
jgi:hypothetical protein